MVLPEFEYHAPETLTEALKLLAENGPDTKVMAGGTDTLPPMKDGAFKNCKHLIDLKRIPGLNQLEYDEKKGLTIGCLTKLFDIQTSELVHKVNPSISASAKFVASTQVRNKGTMVGNICNASPSCDTACILIAQNAVVHAVSPRGTREIPVEKFFKHVKRTVLEYDEIVTDIVIPPLEANMRAAYTPFTVRKAMDLAIVNVAAWLKLDGDTCVDARIALGAVAITPIRALSAEQKLIGTKLTDEDITAAAVAAMNDCHPIDDVRASADYRKHLVGVFTKRAVYKALQGYEGDII